MKSKKGFWRRCLSSAIALILLASSSSFANVANIYAAGGNLISNSTFDSGVKNWGTYMDGGGSATLVSENGKLALKIKSVGTLNYGVQVFFDVIPLYQNGVYRLRYDISSTVDRDVESMIQQNGGTYQAYTWKGLSITKDPKTVDYTFTMEKETDIMTKLAFNCGNQGSDLGEHTIYLDNVILELVDDSKVEYPSSTANEDPIMINQLGYRTSSKKIAVFRNINGNNKFSVVNADNGEVVYSGSIYGEKQNDSAKEINYYGDFSEITTPGNYYISCGNLKKSYTFKIGENIYNNLLDDSVRMMYLQRCGIQIEDALFGHSACHTSNAVVYGTNKTIDVNGGWHDAGDYGRYVVPAAKTIADLLYAYEANPKVHSDSIGIPESGNGIPDILDETRYGLTWMFKMQSETGGVYHKVTCANFPGYIMPQDENGELIVTPVTTTATADFCAVMAMAYEFYYDIDKAFAEKCLDAAKKAWDFLEKNPNLIFTNPAGVTTGEYGDITDLDERYWAVAQMYRATKESKYVDLLNNLSTKKGLDWSTVGDYGNIAYLTMENVDKSTDLYQKIKSAFITQADTFATSTSNDAYGVAISKFEWGSNMTVANAGVILGLAYKITNDEKYITSSESNLNYLLGRNPLSICFVTGYGTSSPKNPHHRPSMAKNTAMKGMLVGGVNSNLEDSAAKAYLANSAPAKCFVDHAESYSTNEVTTYWNSPLIYLLSLTEGKSGGEVVENVIKGDLNKDNKVDNMDLVLLCQFIIKNIEFDDTQLKASDLTSDGNVDVADCAILKQHIMGDNVLNNK